MGAHCLTVRTLCNFEMSIWLPEVCGKLNVQGLVNLWPWLQVSHKPWACWQKAGDAVALNSRGRIFFRVYLWSVHLRNAIPTGICSVSTFKLSMKLKQPERMSKKVQGAQNTHRQQGSPRDSHVARERIFIFTCCNDQKCQAVVASFLTLWQRAVIFLLVNTQSQHSTVTGITPKGKAYPKLGTKTQAWFRKCRSYQKSSLQVTPPCV